MQVILGAIIGHKYPAGSPCLFYWESGNVATAVLEGEIHPPSSLNETWQGMTRVVIHLSGARWQKAELQQGL